MQAARLLAGTALKLEDEELSLPQRTVYLKPQGSLNIPRLVPGDWPVQFNGAFGVAVHAKVVAVEEEELVVVAGRDATDEGVDVMDATELLVADEDAEVAGVDKDDATEDTDVAVAVEVMELVIDTGEDAVDDEVAVCKLVEADVAVTEDEVGSTDVVARAVDDAEVMDEAVDEPANEMTISGVVVVVVVVVGGGELAVLFAAEELGDDVDVNPADEVLKVLDNVGELETLDVVPGTVEDGAKDADDAVEVAPELVAVGLLTVLLVTVVAPAGAPAVVVPIRIAALKGGWPGINAIVPLFR